MIQRSAARSVVNELMLPRSTIMRVGVFPRCKLCSQPSQEMELALIFGFGCSFRQICLFTCSQGERKLTNTGGEEVEIMQLIGLVALIKIPVQRLPNVCCMVYAEVQ